MKNLALITNIPSFEKVSISGVSIKHTLYSSNGNFIARSLKQFFLSFKYDYIVFNMLQTDVYLIALFKFLFPFNRCRLIVIDIILPIPTTPTEKLKAYVRSTLFKKVHKFLNYAKNTVGFERIYHIPNDKFKYIPFKINNIEAIKNLNPTDEGYIFVGGQTRRDFATFFAAVKNIDYPIRVVTPDTNVLKLHGSTIEKQNLTDNITLIHDARTPETFTRQIMGARLVVIPIVKDNISPSGIGVYLQCMALHKCVIISTGPAVDNILTNKKEAFLVPPEDPGALHDAIMLALKNDELRKQVASNGYNYAASLGDENDLNQNIAEYLYDDKYQKNT